MATLGFLPNLNSPTAPSTFSQVNGGGVFITAAPQGCFFDTLYHAVSFASLSCSDGLLEKDVFLLSVKSTTTSLKSCLESDHPLVRS